MAGAAASTAGTAGIADGASGTAVFTVGAAGNTAGRATDGIAGKTLVSAPVSSSIEQGAGQQPLTSKPLPSISDCSQAVDADIFLQDLFTCPLTSVSRHCNSTISYCNIVSHCHK